ncbi:MAG: NUDIX hydrolase [Bryobacteraceae bacterium]|nr:NUDIX hydrolase [Bryobacteraceae bacterium]MDW8378713.1 NUDIX hydrolase [Bryobacterales bacterium]
MTRAWLLDRLARYRCATAQEADLRVRFQAFVAEYEECFERSLKIGHVTGSAWLVDLERTHVLLTHHQKLDKWLQLGGHADGDRDVLRVALREAQEESGLCSIRAVSDEIFDLDIHRIPARQNEPEHWHYDVRFFCEADRNEPLRLSSESKELRWVGLGDLPRLTSEESILRMARKMKTWRGHSGGTCLPESGTGGRASAW